MRRVLSSFVSSMSMVGSLALLAIFFFAVIAPSGASAAEPLEPWWHMTSGAVPSYLPPAGAPKHSEVQQLAVNATGGRCYEEAAFKKEEGVILPGGCYKIERPETAAFDNLIKFNAPSQELQGQLEELYGAGNVHVSGGPAVTATGNMFGPATATGNLTEGSPVVKGVFEVKKFGVGQSIEGTGIPAGATILAVDREAGGTEGTLTLSKNAEVTAESVELKGLGSKTVEDVTATDGSGSFKEGEAILGGGIAPGTTVEAIEPLTHTLTLSKEPTGTREGAVLSSALEPYTIAFAGELASQPIAPIKTEKSVAITLPGECEPGKPNSCPGTVTVTEQQKGSSPDGQLVVTAANLGDAPTVPCTRVPAGDGKYRDAACSEEVEPKSAEGVYEKSPVVLTDTVPAGLKPTIEGTEGVAGAASTLGNEGPFPCTIKGQVVTCTFSGALPPYDQLEAKIGVVNEGAHTGESNVATISGGEAPHNSVRGALTVSEAPTPFGIQYFALTPEEAGGAPDALAGSHPFQLTTTFAFNEVPGTGGAFPAGLPKDLLFRWPAGLIGNPTAVPRCTLAQFLTAPGSEGGNECPAASAVGVSIVTYNPVGEATKQGEVARVITETQGLYNLEPSPGEPARFAFTTPIGSVFIDTSVRSGEDYGVSVEVKNITQVPGFLRSQTTVWGVPGDQRHDLQRGTGCLRQARGQKELSCLPLEQATPPAFVSLPASCPSPAPQASIQADSWQQAGAFTAPLATSLPAMSGCNQLPFTPSITVKPDGTAASSPTGMTVDVHVPQQETLNPHGLAEGDPKNITVTLPEGVAVNPAGGDGLQACSEGLVGFQGQREFAPVAEPGAQTLAFAATPSLAEAQPGVDFCPDAAKIATAEITTPLLPPTQPIVGSVYLASQNQNPFGSLLAMYIVAEDPASGVLVKLAGQVHLSETGQLTATFEDSPQAPFEDAKLHFFGGERAPLATPARCGSYTTTASFTSWSSSAPVTSTSSFGISSGPKTAADPGGSPCTYSGQTLPFAPSLTGGTTSNDAGAFSPLSTTLSREDGQQDLQSVVLHMPAGLEGTLAGVKLCPEAQANNGTCGPESLIGETTVSAGVGNDPVSVTGGRVYITEKYAGAPFGLSIVNPVKAGPFDLEHDTANPNQQPPCDCVVVRGKLEIDPVTADLTFTSDPSGPHAIPHLIDGVPVQIKKVNVTVNREKFIFNPTNCSSLAMTGQIGSEEGASSTFSAPFQATNCANLKYTPALEVSTAGKASKTNGASLHFKIAYPKGAMGSQSWMREMKFDIPKQLPARLTTIQKACLAGVFEHNRSACPPASIIGHVLVHTPVLPVPLEGPLYFVSYGGAAFPDAVAVIKGYGVTIESHGKTFINGKTGVTSATFESVPDVPFESIEVSVPQGPFSEFGANLPAKANDNFCGQHLVMPILFKAQNGMEIHQNVPVGVTGCKGLTRAQKLAAALKACHKKHGKKRASCEKAARKAYGARAGQTAKKKHR